MFQLDKHDYLVGELHLANRSNADETLVHLSLLDISDVAELRNEVELVFPDIFRHEDLEILVAVAHLSKDSAFILHQLNCLLVLEEIVYFEALKDLLESNFHET